MLRATENALRRLIAREAAGQSIQAWDVFAADQPRVSLLKDNGYAIVTDDWCVATRSLAGDIPAPSCLRDTACSTSFQRRTSSDVSPAARI